MKIRDRIIEAALALAQETPSGKITLAALARTSGISWPTVRRYVDGKEGLPGFLESIGAVFPETPEHQAEASDTLDTRTQILEAAFKTFAENGYSGSTLDNVAAEAGLTKGAVYWHFKGKDDLCMALIEEHFRREAIRIPENVHKIIDQTGGQQALETFIAREVEQARRADAWRQLGYEFMSRSRKPAIRQRYAEIARTMHGETTPLAQWLIDSGVIDKDLDPKTVAFTWRCLLLGMGQWMSQDPDGADFEGMGPKMAQVMWRGMAPKNAEDMTP
jgi:AcrR family transcriptional regulator